MGYIHSGTTLVAYLTQTGRELLLKGDNSNFKIKYFALGDSDVNYSVEDKLEAGFIPDLSGNNNSCVKSLSKNIDIKNKIRKE